MAVEEVAQRDDAVLQLGAEFVHVAEPRHLVVGDLYTPPQRRRRRGEASEQQGEGAGRTYAEFDEGDLEVVERVEVQVAVFLDFLLQLLALLFPALRERRLCVNGTGHFALHRLIRVAFLDDGVVAVANQRSHPLGEGVAVCVLEEEGSVRYVNRGHTGLEGGEEKRTERVGWDTDLQLCSSAVDSFSTSCSRVMLSNSSKSMIPRGVSAISFSK